MMSRLPQLDEYHRAVQSPGTNFVDPDLRASRAATNVFGMPVCDSGGFALTFRLNGVMQQWAVRCFHREVADRQERYAAISRFLKQHPTPYFTPIDYLPQGIRVDGSWYPITKMAWVQGVTLGLYIEQNIQTPEKLDWLPGEFIRLVDALETMQVAHGDLQHRNLIVTGNRLVLIDYDGMYVPDLGNRRSAELGLPDYQHPSRTEDDFGPQLDRFSSIVIILSLRALAKKPDLWRRYSTGENLIFRQRDFIKPDQSALLAELERVPDLRADVSNFRQLCSSSLTSIPRLNNFLSGVLPTIPTAPTRPAFIRHPYPVVDASNRTRMLDQVGQRVTAVGRITDVNFRMTKYGKPYAFMNFADWRTGCFTVVLWSDALDLFAAQGVPPPGLLGKWVKVTGFVDVYRSGDWPDRPQMIVEMPAEIETLADGEAEAMELLSNGAVTPPSPPRQASKSVMGSQPATAVSPPWYHGSGVTTPHPAGANLYSGQTQAHPSTLQPTQMASRQAVQSRSVGLPSSTSKPTPFQAVQKSQPKLSVSELVLDFGYTEGNRSLQRTIFLINDGMVDTVATIRTNLTASWLSVGVGSVNCPAKSRQPIVVEVSDHHQLGPGGHFTSFDIVGAGQRWSVIVSVKVNGPILHLSTSKMTVITDTEGNGKALLNVRNLGNSRLIVTGVGFGSLLQGKCIVTPNSFVCEPRDEQSIVVEIRGLLGYSRESVIDGLFYLLSNGGKHDVRVMVRGSRHVKSVSFESTKPRLVVRPIDISLGDFDGSAQLSRTVEIANPGKDVLEGTIEFKDPEWLWASKQYFRVLPDDSDSIEILVRPKGAVELRLPQIQRRSLENAIKINSNGGEVIIPVKLVSTFHGKRQQ